jgi:hypothetical protein
MKTPGNVDQVLAQDVKRCGIQLDQPSYKFEVRVRVGQIYSPRVSVDAFTYEGPHVRKLSFHTLKMDVVKPFTVNGDNFEKATQLAWECPGVTHGFHEAITDPGITVTGAGSQIQTKTPGNVSKLDFYTSCGFTKSQKSFSFDVRVRVGMIYSPRVAADKFTYTK